MGNLLISYKSELRQALVRAFAWIDYPSILPILSILVLLSSLFLSLLGLTFVTFLEYILLFPFLPFYKTPRSLRSCFVLLWKDRKVKLLADLAVGFARCS